MYYKSNVPLWISFTMTKRLWRFHSRVDTVPGFDAWGVMPQSVLAGELIHPNIFYTKLFFASNLACFPRGAPISLRHRILSLIYRKHGALAPQFLNTSSPLHMLLQNEIPEVFFR
jgi:hypothetical protein